jgi:hypothetical protein
VGVRTKGEVIVIKNGTVVLHQIHVHSLAVDSLGDLLYFGQVRSQINRSHPAWVAGLTVREMTF